MYFSSITKVESDTSIGTQDEIVLAQAPRPILELLAVQLLVVAGGKGRQEAGTQ